MSLVVAVIVGCIYLIFAALPISCMMHLITENIEYIDKIEKNPQTEKNTNIPPILKGCFYSQWQVSILGIIERILYLISILIGKPEFIAAWLGIKTVYIALSEKNVSGRRIYNNFLIGNGISILYAFASAGIIQWSSGLFLQGSSLKTKMIFLKNPCLAIFSGVAPIVLSILLIVTLYIVRNGYKRMIDPH